jgi:hypothetical protein
MIDKPSPGAMDQEKPLGKLFCVHELARIARPARSLHERMLLEAEPYVKHNWTDLAIHDKDRLRVTPVNHALAWMIGETGSYLTPLYCKLSDKSKWQASPLALLAPIQIYITALHEQMLLLRGAQLAKFQRRQAYIIVKRNSPSGGDIIPVDFDELASMCCTNPKHKWTPEGLIQCE